MADPDELSAWYRGFAENETAGKSPSYTSISLAIADDPDILRALLTLPPDKRQPNLLLAAFRYVCGAAADAQEFREKFWSRRAEIEAVTRSHRTQTNEPGRCAPLALALAQLSQPLALIEVGASAGLCLFPERYRYRYGSHEYASPQARADAPLFECDLTGSAPLPETPIDVTWRIGVDLNPIDVTDEEQTAWLETLVWPEQQSRLERLRNAIDTVRRDPPRIIAGDLRTDIEALIQQTPPGSIPVVFHTAVLLYLEDPAERLAFGRHVMNTGATWISNEPVGALDLPDYPANTARTSRDYLLAVNGTPVAIGDAHGTRLHWLGTNIADLI